jgi:hypothetical protein
MLLRESDQFSGHGWPARRHVDMGLLDVSQLHAKAGELWPLDGVNEGLKAGNDLPAWHSPDSTHLDDFHTPRLNGSLVAASRLKVNHKNRRNGLIAGQLTGKGVVIRHSSASGQ